MAMWWLQAKCRECGSNQDAVTGTDFWINSNIWSNGLIYLCLAAGVYFSIRTRFVQVRQIPEMIR